MAFKEELTKFGQGTSVKGVSRLFKAKSTEIKLLWSVAVVICMIIGSYQTYSIISQYFSYTKVTRIVRHKVKPTEDLVFPNIQVCNINPSGWLRNLPWDKNMSSFQDLTLKMTTCLNCSVDENEIWDRTQDEILNWGSYIEFLGITRAKSLMKDTREFLVECIIFSEKKDCYGLVDITIVPSFQYFLCLNLQFPSNMTIISVSMTFYVDSFKSEMKMYSGENEFSMTSAGVVFTVLERGNRNKYYQSKNTASPGQKTRVQIKRKIIKRLPHPHGDCLESTKTQDSFDHCFGLHWESNFKELCQREFEIIHEEENSSDTMIHCFSLQQKQSELYERSKCVFSHWDYVLDDCYRNCHERCQTTSYDVEVTTSKWPLPFQYDSFYEQIIAPRSFAGKFNDLFQNNSSPEENESKMIKAIYRKQLIEDNFVNIHFSMDTNFYFEYNEVSMYTVSSLVGTLGGVLNLWTGTTVLVVIEILESIINIVNQAGFKKTVDDVKVREIKVME